MTSKTYFIILAVLIVLPIVVKLIFFFMAFGAEYARIIGERNRACDADEYRYWNNKLKRHMMTLIPFAKKRHRKRNSYHKRYRK